MQKRIIRGREAAHACVCGAVTKCGETTQQVRFHEISGPFCVFLSRFSRVRGNVERAPSSAKVKSDCLMRGLSQRGSRVDVCFHIRKSGCASDDGWDEDTPDGAGGVMCGRFWRRRACVWEEMGGGSGM